MEPAAILEQLTASEDLPKEALRAASDRRADMAPLFVERIESYRGSGLHGAGEPSPAFSSFIFSATGGRPRPTACLARLLRCPPDDVDGAMGDATMETAHKIIAAVFDGDPNPIYNIILDQNADEYVRSRMCETLAMLVLHGQAGSCPGRFLPARLLDQSAAARWLLRVARLAEQRLRLLGLVELRDVVKEALDRKDHSSSMAAVSGDFEDDLALALLKPTEPWGEHRATNTRGSAARSRSYRTGNDPREEEQAEAGEMGAQRL